MVSSRQQSGPSRASEPAPAGRQPVGIDAGLIARAVVLLGVLVGSQEVIYLGADGAATLGAIIVGLALATAVLSTHAWWVRACVAAAVVLILLRVDGMGREFVYASCVLAGVVAWFANRTSPERSLSMLLALAPLLLYHVVLDLVPAAQVSLRAGTEMLSRAITGKVGLGPSAHGVPVAAALLGLALSASRERASIGLGARFAMGISLSAAALVGIALAHASLALPIAQELVASGWLGGSTGWLTIGLISAMMPLCIAMLASTVIVLWTWFTAWSTQPRDMIRTSQPGDRRAQAKLPAKEGVTASPAVSPRRAAPTATLGMLAMIGAAVAGWPYAQGQSIRSEVLVLDRGLVNFDTPKWEIVGVASTGMFGLLTQHLEARGNTVTKVPSLEELDKASSDTLLLVINPEKVTETEIEKFHAFLARGGTAMVLGDHTDINETKQSTNALIRALGVELRVDSAFPITSGWEGKFGSTGHPLLVGLDRFNVGLGYSTGATLDVTSARVRPILLGRYVFADAADYKRTRGDLRGDYRYALGESFGDHPLAVEVPHGKGRVLIFADTSSFQNISMAWSWPWVERVMRRASTPPHAVESLAPWIGAGTVVLLAVMMALAAWRPTSGPTPLLAGAGVALAMLVTRYAAIPAEPSTGSRPIAIVDIGHGANVSTAPWQSDSINGLLLTLSRSGYEPWIVGAGRPMPPQTPWDAYVMVSPQHALTPRDIAPIIRRVEEGGVLLINAGGESHSAQCDAWRHMGFQVGSVPLGPLPLRPKVDMQEFATIMTQPQMSEAYELSLEGEGWAPRFVDSGRVIAAERTYGKGRIAVVGDEMYLWDRSIEAEQEGWIGNMRFVQSLVRPTKSEPSEQEAPTAQPEVKP